MNKYEGLKIKIVGMRFLDENFISNSKLDGEIHLFLDENNKYDKTAIDATYLDEETGEYVKFGYVSKDTKKFSNLNKIYRIRSMSYYIIIAEEVEMNDYDVEETNNHQDFDIDLGLNGQWDDYNSNEYNNWNQEEPDYRLNKN